MPTPIKTNPPPETEILSETRREITDPSQTSPNPGLADPSQVAAEETSEETLEQKPETVDQPFTIDEGGEPPPPEPLGDEPPADEPTGIPLKDTQAALTKTSQELAKIKKVLAFMVANAQTGGGQAPPQLQQPPIPPEMLSSEPTEDERLDPTRYTKRMMLLQDMDRRREATIQEMQTFTDTHSDWQDLLPTMQQIRNENPDAYQRPGSLSRLHRVAKEREELLGYRSAMKGSADIALQAGANMQRKKGGSAFVSPSGGGGGGGRGQIKMPPPDVQANTEKYLQWLKDHGFYKEDTF